MTKPKRPNFSPEFRLEAAQLVVDQGYKVRDAAEAMGVGKSTMDITLVIVQFIMNTKPHFF